MPSDTLTYLDDYKIINGGAHRKAASVVGAPSFVRRLGFWNTDAEQVREGSTKQVDIQKALRASSDRRRQAYNDYYRGLQRVITANKCGHLYHEEGSFAQRSDTGVHSGTLCTLRFWWHGIRATVRLEYHAEYITVTSILDCSVEPYPEFVPHDDGMAGPLMRDMVVRRLDRLKRFFDAEPQQAAPAREKPGTPVEREKREETRKERLKAVHESIAVFRDDIWDRFQMEVLAGSSGTRLIIKSLFGKVFADFRGMVTGSDPQWVDKPEDRPANRMQSAFTRPKSQSRNRDIRHDEPTDGLIRDTIKRLWPVIEFEEKLQDHEFAAGAFLDGRAIYISALGPQPLEKDEKFSAVYYHIHTFTDDEWQIGRLIERINTLGTLRLAASRDIKKLSEANALIDEVSASIDQAASLLQKAISRSNDDGGMGDDEVAEGMLDRINQTMLDIQDKITRIDEINSGNISARLQRSEYYLEQFTQEVKALREKRIEGYQKYQEFVARRMNGVFRYYDLLRHKLGEVDQGRAALARQYSSLKIATVTEEIRGIQKVGDIALIGILVPYYLAMMADHIFDLKDRSGGDAVLVGVAMAFAGYVIFKRRRLDWSGRPWWRRVLSVSTFFMLYLMIMTAGVVAKHLEVWPMTHPTEASRPASGGNALSATEAPTPAPALAPANGPGAKPAPRSLPAGATSSAR